MHPDTSYIQAEVRTRASTSDTTIETVVRVAVICALAAMAVMSFTRNINWDEFYFLSHVHANLNGHLDRPMQTVFVHAFGWLSKISTNEVDQITAARLIMLGFFGATCFAIHRIATNLADTKAADIAVLAFVTSGFAIAHGNSFRADPMAASLLICAVAIMMTTRMGVLQIIAVAILSAFALLVTVKSAMYLPVYVGALIWRWGDRGIILRCLGAGVLALVIAAALFFWHASGITPTEGAEVSSNLSEAASVTLGGSGFLPRWPEVSLWLMFSAGSVIMAVASMVFAPTKRTQAVVLLFAVPFLSVLFYRNAFPYFFPFAVAPLMAVIAIGATCLRGSLIAKLAIVLMLANGVMQTQRAFSEGNTAQRATIAEIHRLFPEPVAYIDQNGMISSFERLGFFMSTWGLATYRAAGKPVFADLIIQHQPPLLLTNRDALHAAMNPGATNAMFVGLMPEDAEILRKTYVHYAGVIWLAGQNITLTGGAARAQIPFSGSYRIEATAPVTVNGQTMRDGDVIQLNDGPIMVDGIAGTKVKIVWNTGGETIKPALLEKGLYAGFWRL
jgi:hypothetical protein